MHQPHYIGLVFLLLVPEATLGAYSQNFDTLAAGAVHGQDGWAGPSGSIIQSSVAKDGQALEVGFNGNQTTVRPGIFDTAAVMPQARLEFDIYLPVTIGDVTGQPNRSINATVWWNGPSDAFRAFSALHYRGQTDSNGNFRFDRFEFNNASLRSGPVSNETWYHVSADMDWVTGMADIRITNPDGSAFYDPPATEIFSSGVYGTNIIALDGDLDDDLPPRMYVDNIVITPVPEPAAGGAITMVVAVMLLSRSRRDADLTASQRPMVGLAVGWRETA